MRTYNVREMGVSATTMQAVVQREYGGPETFSLESLVVPAPGPDEVLVQVHAAGVDRGTEHLMTGRPWLARLGIGLRRPKVPTPGRDLAGVICALGPGVEGWAVGDAVMGTANGSFAEYAVVPVKRLARKPGNVSFPHAAIIAISGLTALAAVRERGQVSAGQSVLVLGASGGVGSYAVQLAVAAGASVTGVSSAGKLDFVRSLGASRVLDYAAPVPADEGGYDVIIDCGGNAALGTLRRRLTPRGTLVIVGGEQSPGPVLAGFQRQLSAPLYSLFVPQRITAVISAERGAEMQVLADLVEDGAIRPPLDRTFALDQAADALAYLGAGEVRGKIALDIAGPSNA